MGKFITKNLPSTINGGDNIIAFTDAKTFKANFGEHDYSSLWGWYKEDPDHNNLGLVDLFANITNYPQPMWMQMLKKDAVISVDGVGGTFTYDTPIASSYEVVTTEDTSKTCGDKPGIDDSVFELVLNAEFRQNDILTYDVVDGCQVIISADIRPRKEGDSWRYWVKLISNGKSKFFPKDKLRAGIKYWKISDALGEFSTQYSGINGISKAGMMRSEFRLGGLRGVETEITRFAGEKNLKYSEKYTQYFVEEAYRKIANFGDMDFKPNLAVIGTSTNGKNINPKSMKVASMLSLFAVAELAKMEAYQLMFQQGGTVKDNNGVIHINEGLYHQLRRGYKIRYGRPGGITKDMFRQAADYIFRGRHDLPYSERKMKFECGGMAYLNIMDLFKEEFYAQLHYIEPLLGTDRLLPSNPISGTNDAMVMGAVGIKSVFLPGIGQVEVEHNPSLDYVDMVDRQSLVDQKTPSSSYSCIMQDITDSRYSNAFVNVPSTMSANIGNINNNVFYVKPEGPSMYWGYEHGRYASTTASGEVDSCSSNHLMAEQFWCNSASAVWVRDASKFLIIEMCA